MESETAVGYVLDAVFGVNGTFSNVTKCAGSGDGTGGPGRSSACLATPLDGVRRTAGPPYPAYRLGIATLRKLRPQSFLTLAPTLAADRSAPNKRAGRRHVWRGFCPGTASVEFDEADKTCFPNQTSRTEQKRAGAWIRHCSLPSGITSGLHLQETTTLPARKARMSP